MAACENLSGSSMQSSGEKLELSLVFSPSKVNLAAKFCKPRRDIRLCAWHNMKSVLINGEGGN